MNKRLPKTLQWQIADDIIADIASGTLKHNDKLPSELELSASYGVARSTVRGAVQKLAKEKLISAVQGLGTFVTGNARTAISVQRRRSGNAT